MKKRKKPKRIVMRFRKNDPAHNLLAATQHWVRANGGDLVVVGGIGLMGNWNEYRFSVVIGCVGTRPVLKTKAVEE